MPQWDFLNFIAGKARTFPGFRLEMGSTATGLVERDGAVRGVMVRTADGTEHDMESPLVVGADGRDSIVRRMAELEVEDLDRRWMCFGSSYRAATTIRRSR